MIETGNSFGPLADAPTSSSSATGITASASVPERPLADEISTSDDA
jgi:hypothetical protein